MGGLRVYAVDWPGPRQPAQDPVLLLHGLGGSTIGWESIGAELAERLETRVTAIDLLGFGRTRLPSGRSTMAHNVQIVTKILEREGPAILVGNSMGGAISVGVAGPRPELVRGLVLVDCAFPGRLSSLEHLGIAARFSLLGIPRVGAYFVDRKAGLLGAEGLVESTLQLIMARPERLDAQVRRRVIDLAEERLDYSEAAASYSSAARSLFGYLARTMRRDIALVRTTTLMVHGALDRLVPLDVAQAVTNRRPDWELEVFEDCGHVPQLEMPGRFLDLVVDWFERRDERAIGA